MSHGTYVNLEKITLEIIEEKIQDMDERNYMDLFEGEPDYDLDLLLSNYKRGYIVVTMMVSLIESFLNDILNQVIMHDSYRLLESSVDNKIDILYTFKSKDPNKLRGSHFYDIFKKVRSIRNGLIHYKKSHIGDSFIILSIKIGKLDLGKIFTKSIMEEYFENIKELIDTIGEDLNLRINYEAHPIASDGYDDNYRFVEVDNSL